MGMVCLGAILLLHPFFLHASPPSLVIFAGAASKPASEEVAGLFTQRKRVQVRITFGGSGFVLSQMKLARRGDVYFPGSSDFMEKAKRERLVFPETEKIVAYLVPAINVQRGNPHNIRVLQDLLRPGIRMGIAYPETVCVGTYAVEVIERNFTPEEQFHLRKNLVTTVESCERVANIISLKAVDAVLGWRVFEHWDPKRIETVLLKAKEVPRIGYIPAAVSAFTKDRDLAEDFIRFLLSPEAQSVFRRYGYLTGEEEARRYTFPETPVGGEYSLPGNWGRRTR
jgi:molybdate transport system substrate-binding protein